MLTRNITTTKPIPNEPGQSMTFRQLGWRQLAEAEEIKSGAQLRNIRHNMGAELLRDLQNMNRDQIDKDAAAQVKADPLAPYDQAAVLYAGIAEWTYPEKLTHDNIDALDGATAKWAAGEIIALGMPPLEQDIEDRFFGSRSSSMATTAPATQTIAVSAALQPGPQTNGSSV